jgi:hypothetical protein
MFLIATAAPAAAQRAAPPTPVRRPAPHPEVPTGSAAAPKNELDCRNCHEAKHQGVVQMYLGLGGRGTPMIPSHMFQVRVQCVACHIAPEEEAGTAAIVGRTFRPSEQACIGCHGEKYRGMLARWSDTLGKMRGAIEPKLAAARAALGAGDPKAAKAARGYCAVLCHEQAGVKLPATVTFGKQKIPHARHVAEFGAVCTACHSADVHKAVTAKPATCTACHHSPANERCESCHRAQSAFYRGQTKTELAKVAPNVMVNAVGCTGCHDMAKKHSRQAVGDKCVGCHDAAYTSFLTEWMTGGDQAMAKTAAAVKRAEAAVARGGPEARARLKAARDALALVRKARPVHNPDTAGVLLDVARQKAEASAGDK